jgi:hypothetical protein
VGAITARTENPRAPRWLMLSLGANLGTRVFKYFNFRLSAAAFLAWLGLRRACTR